MEQIRINKYLTQANYCSRRQGDRLIEQGRVKINDRKAKLGDKVSSSDVVNVDGEDIQTSNADKVYLAFNKPVGVICTSDPKAKDNVIDAVGYPERVYTIGRLDVISSGLILLTNDGEVVNKILKGQNKVEKEYQVEVSRDISEKFLKVMRSGVYINKYKTLPAKVKQTGTRAFSIVIVEGKKRQVRRMCEKLGYDVFKLKRVRIGKLDLGNLKEGTYKNISLEEVI
ncbi:pseudouridine synthase [Patescibacteria group bacterium]|nr:pseudouridine synthase [Patescibacteria group bacterium]MBU1074716.1 pseudouridine synthase [Patescibacteria group bacterium]MBU1952274.1 pseudouridine synthase [Patescibacteria group bacterium]